MSTTTLNIPTRDKTEAETDVAAANKDVVREVAGTEGTVFLSSERFNFVGLEESGAVDSIDQASQLFTGLTKKPPTLEEALTSMGYENAKELAELFTKKTTEKQI